MNWAVSITRKRVTMKKAKLKSTTQGRTKRRPTKKNHLVTVGARKYAVPPSLYAKLVDDLEPHLVEVSGKLSAKEFFTEETLPEWSIFLRGLRHREDLTQLEFAQMIGVPQSNLSAMENGRRGIGKELAKKIASIFDTDYRYFL